MKKAVFMMLAVAALGLTACDNSNSAARPGKPSGQKEVLYSGIMPAADAQGTIYTLKLDYDDDHNFIDGDFMMVENSLVSDTLEASGLRAEATAYTEGDFRRESKQVNGQTVEYIRLIPDAKDGLGAASSDQTYFIVNADGSLTMVGADLQKSETPGLNYTLTVR